MTAEQASAFAERLTKRYVNMQDKISESYVADLIAVFCSYPLNAGRVVIDPVNGALATAKFPPNIAEVNIALKAEMRRRAIIIANAKAHIAEAAERERKQADAVQDNSPEAIERRKLVAQQILNNWHNSDNNKNY